MASESLSLTKTSITVGKHLVANMLAGAPRPIVSCLPGPLNRSHQPVCAFFSTDRTVAEPVQGQEAEPGSSAVSVVQAVELAASLSAC
jgi:hypothetical protein